MIDTARKWINFAFATVALLAVAVTEVAADCMSSCQSSYYACTAGFNARDCATRRSICQNRCIMGSNSYGAIAFAPSTGEHGYGYEYHAPGDAKRRALAECKAQSGAEDCTLEVWFNNACGALASGADGVLGSAYAGTKAAAESAALDYCQEANGGENCSVDISLCSR